MSSFESDFTKLSSTELSKKYKTLDSASVSSVLEKNIYNVLCDEISELSLHQCVILLHNNLEVLKTLNNLQINTLKNNNVYIIISNKNLLETQI